MSTEMPPHLIWWLTLASPIICRQTQLRGYLNPTSLHPGLVEQEEIDSLKEHWGITDRPSLHKQISSLLNDGSHGHYLVEEYRQYACRSAIQWQQIIDSQETCRRRTELSYVAMTFHQVGVGGTRAYDYCRASYLIREGLRLDWVSQQEFDFLHSFIARSARYHYHSWKQYTQATVAGRAIWLFLINEPDTEEACHALLNGWIMTQQRNGYRKAVNDKHNPIHSCEWHIQEMPQLSIPQSLTDLLNQIQE